MLETSIGGLNRDEFSSLYLARINYSDLTGAEYAPPSYDAIWAAALSLNATLGKMKQKGAHACFDCSLIAYTHLLYCILVTLCQRRHTRIQLGHRGDPTRSPWGNNKYYT